MKSDMSEQQKKEGYRLLIALFLTGMLLVMIVLIISSVLLWINIRN